MSALHAAERYVGHGFAVVPVPHGKKSPVLKGWERLRLSADELPSHFNGNPLNIGLILGEPSGWLVDVDLDVNEAVKIAGRFLPPTLTSGRESSPLSHWWYVSPGAETVRYKDVNDEVLVEQRSTGCQTLVAPSIHPSGERYVWNTASALEIAEVPPQELARGVRELATAALLGRHVPPVGGRHDYALAVAGFLLRGGRLAEDVVRKILLAAWHAAGADSPEAVRDIEGIVRDTAEKLEAGEPVSGGPTLEESAPGVVGRLCKWWSWNRNERREGRHEVTSEEKEERRNQADRLIGYALEDAAALFTDQHGAPHALVDGEPLPLNSRCYSWLRRLMWEGEGRAVNGEYLKTASGTLAAHAEFSGEVRELHTRAAWHGEAEALYYQLRLGRVVRVDASGWDFEPNPPVLFRRFPNLRPLPDPERGGTLSVVDALVNLKSERDRRLFAAYLATVPLPHIGRPILNASGVMGSGKTTAQRLIKRLLDPGAPETVRFDPRDFLQKASHSFVVMLDNQNTIPEWAADTLCRLVTGEADSKRRLYTDDEDVIIELRRAVLLNGINIPTDRGDVLDRSLVVELERIPDRERRTEEELWERFEAEHPQLLGALFDLLSMAITRKASLLLSRRPRLADWGEYAASVYEVMGWEEDGRKGAALFLQDWNEVVKVQNQATLDGSPVAQAIIKFMEDKDEYTASSSELHSKLKVVAAQLGVSVDRDKAWPKSARWFWRRIREVLPVLLAADIEAHRTEVKSGSKITLRKTPTDDATNTTPDENREDKPKTAGNNDGSNATDASSNATGGNTIGPDATLDTTAQAHNYAGSGEGGISGIRDGDSSEETVFAASPGRRLTIEEVRRIFRYPSYYGHAAAKARERLLEAGEADAGDRFEEMCRAVLTAAREDPNRWEECAGEVLAALQMRDGGGENGGKR